MGSENPRRARAVRERRSARVATRARAGGVGPVSRPGAAADRATYTMRRLDEVRVLAHPLRIKLLELFAAEPRTTKQAAEILGENPTRLYHHVNALERVGLIALDGSEFRVMCFDRFGEIAAEMEACRVVVLGHWRNLATCS